MLAAVAATVVASAIHPAHAAEPAQPVLTATDLGSAGGPITGVTAHNSGAITGHTEDSGPFLYRDGEFTRLLPPGYHFAGWNDRDDIVYGAPNGTGYDTIYLGRGRRIIDLTPPGTTYAISPHLNQRGQVLLSTYTRFTQGSQQQWAHHVHLWSEGRFTLIADPASGTDGTDGTALRGVFPEALNNNGHALVSTDYGIGKYAVWKDGRLHPIDTTGLRTLYVRGMDDAGRVLVWGVPQNEDPPRAMLWYDGEHHPVTADGQTLHPVAIAASGHVTGMTRNGEPRAYLWRDGQGVSLGPLPGHAASMPIAANGRGQVLVESRITEASREQPRFHVWEDGRTVELLPPEGTTGTWRPTSLNERGQVAGAAGNHVLLWTP